MKLFSSKSKDKDKDGKVYKYLKSLKGKALMTLAAAIVSAKTQSGEVGLNYEILQLIKEVCNLSDDFNPVVQYQVLGR